MIGTDRGRGPALEKAGAKVDFHGPPDFDVGEAHDTYLQLLLAHDERPRPRLRPHRRRGPPASTRTTAASTPGTCASRPPATATFAIAAEARDLHRWAWRAFFADHDVLLAPITATPPFPHDHSEPLAARTMTVNGADVPYFGQLFWAGLAISAHLPATAAPIGRTSDGLPVGMQIIGDAYRDRTTIWTGRPARQADRRLHAAARVLTAHRGPPRPRCISDPPAPSSFP